MSGLASGATRGCPLLSHARTWLPPPSCLILSGLNSTHAATAESRSNVRLPSLAVLAPTLRSFLRPPRAFPARRGALFGPRVRGCTCALGRLASRRLCTFSRVPVAETLERGQLVCSGPGQRWTRLGRGNGAPRHRGGVHCHPMGAGSGPPALSVSHRLGALQPSWEGTAGPMGPAFSQAPWSPVCSMRPGNPAGETPLWAASAADPTRRTPCSRGLRKGAPTAGSEPASRAPSTIVH